MDYHDRQFTLAMPAQTARSVGGAHRACSGWRVSGGAQAGAEGFQKFAFRNAKACFQRIRWAGLSSGQDLAFTISQPCRRARTTAVNSQKATHESQFSVLER